MAAGILLASDGGTNGMVDLENLRRQIFASAVGSITATLALNPIGVLKVRAQAGQGKLPQIVKKILRDSGLIGFWTGARLGMIQSLPSTIVYMTSYENIRDVLVQSLPESSRFAAPGIAGLRFRFLPSKLIDFKAALLDRLLLLLSPLLSSLGCFNWEDRMSQWWK